MLTKYRLIPCLTAHLQTVIWSLTGSCSTHWNPYTVGGYGLKWNRIMSYGLCPMMPWQRPWIYSYIIRCASKHCRQRDIVGIPCFLLGAIILPQCCWKFHVKRGTTLYLPPSSFCLSPPPSLFLPPSTFPFPAFSPTRTPKPFLISFLPFTSPPFSLPYPFPCFSHPFYSLSKLSFPLNHSKLVKTGKTAVRHHYTKYDLRARLSSFDIYAVNYHRILHQNWMISSLQAHEMIPAIRYQSYIKWRGFKATFKRNTISGIKCKPNVRVDERTNETQEYSVMIILLFRLARFISLLHDEYGVCF